MEPKIIKTLCGMEVKMIPKQENIPDFDTKAIQIKHIDYYDPPYSSYEADEITEEVISKILEEIPKGLNIYLYLDPYGEVEMFEVNCDGNGWQSALARMAEPKRKRIIIPIIQSMPE